MPSSDVIVIGAGIAGASVAAELASDCSVTVLEMEDRPGYHSTGRSAASWAPTDGPDIIRALTGASGEFLHRPPAEFTDAPLTAPRGQYVLGMPGEEAKLSAFRALGMIEVPVAVACEQIPLLRGAEIDTVLYEENCRDLDVDALHQGFIRQLRRHGGVIQCDAAAQAISRSNGTWSVTTKQGDFASPVLVNAAGAWTDEVARLAGVQPLGLQPRRRSVALIAPPDGVSIDRWPLAFNAEETLYFKPSGGQLIVSPADVTPVEPHDAWADDFALAEAIDRLQQFLDIEVTRIEHTWGGLRTFAPDGDPVAGFDAAADGFFWLAGQGGYGIQTSPALSRTAAALIRGQEIPQDIAGFGVTRDKLSPRRLG